MGFWRRHCGLELLHRGITVYICSRIFIYTGLPVILQDIFGGPRVDAVGDIVPPALSRVMEKKDAVSVEQPSHNDILSVDGRYRCRN